MQDTLNNCGRGNPKRKRIYSPPTNNKFAALEIDSDDDNNADSPDSPVASMGGFSDAANFESAVESMDDDCSVVSDLRIMLETQSPESESEGSTPIPGSNGDGMPV